jgi:pectate lyase
MHASRLLTAVAGIAAATALIPAAPASAARPVLPSNWADAPEGFASLPGDGIGTTTGGAGGKVVTVRTLDDLKTYAIAIEPLVIEVRNSIDVSPEGDNMIPVGSDKTIVGAGPGAEIVGGGFFINQQHNVIVRNLTIRDSYLAGDWDGKIAANDNDGFRVDTSHHIWIDHNTVERVGDGAMDIRKDSDYVTVSWNVVADTNKALGLGWTTNQITHLTAHHNWVRNTFQRLWSLDNTAAAHLYNNYLEDIGQYGTMARNAGKVVRRRPSARSATEPSSTTPDSSATRTLTRRTPRTVTWSAAPTCTTATSRVTSTSSTAGAPRSSTTARSSPATEARRTTTATSPPPAPVTTIRTASCSNTAGSPATRPERASTSAGHGTRAATRSPSPRW